MSRLKTFLTLPTILAFLLSFSMWWLYFFTDYKPTKTDYFTQIMVFISILVSMLGTIFVINRLIKSSLNKKERLLMTLLIIVAGGAALYCHNMNIGSDFLKKDSFVLSLLSIGQLLLVSIFGWRESKNSKSKFMRVDEVRSFDDEDDGLDQTKMSINFNDD